MRPRSFCPLYPMPYDFRFDVIIHIRCCFHSHCFLILPRPWQKIKLLLSLSQLFSILPSSTFICRAPLFWRDRLFSTRHGKRSDKAEKRKTQRESSRPWQVGFPPLQLPALSPSWPFEGTALSVRCQGFFSARPAGLNWTGSCQTSVPWARGQRWERKKSRGGRVEGRRKQGKQGWLDNNSPATPLHFFLLFYPRATSTTAHQKKKEAPCLQFTGSEPVRRRAQLPRATVTMGHVTGSADRLHRLPISLSVINPLEFVDNYYVNSPLEYRFHCAGVGRRRHLFSGI